MNKTWQLDLIGNKVSYDNNGVVDNRVYNETHQLNSTSAGQDYTYDKRGNQTGSTSSNSSSDENQEQNTRVWDIDGHLASVSEAGQLKASYTYDALGRRIKKTLYDSEGNVSKKRLYIRSGQRVLEEYKSDGESTSIDKRYVYGAYVDEVIYAIHGANQELYYHSDRQYNIRSLTDWKGRAVEYYDYSPYGDRIINTRWYGKNRSTSAYGNAIGFTGRHLDSETDLYYFRARYYDTKQGRFISRDPAGYVDGLGLYNGYFASRFMMDPSGRNCSGLPSGSREICECLCSSGRDNCKDECNRVHCPGTTAAESCITFTCLRNFNSCIDTCENRIN